MTFPRMPETRNPKPVALRAMPLATCLLFAALCGQTLAQPTAFTYQGRLSDGTNAASVIQPLRLDTMECESAGRVVV